MKTPATDTLKALRRGGYTVRVSGGKLKLRGPRKPSEELEAKILEHRDELVRLVAGDTIVDELEVFDMAEKFFGEPDEEEGAA